MKFKSDESLRGSDTQNIRVVAEAPAGGDYYSWGGSISSTKLNKEDKSASGDSADAVTASAVASGEDGTGSLQFSVESPSDWTELWIDMANPAVGGASHVLRSPKYPAYKPNWEAYEVCIF